MPSTPPQSRKKDSSPHALQIVMASWINLGRAASGLANDCLNCFNVVQTTTTVSFAACFIPCITSRKPANIAIAVDKPVNPAIDVD